MAASMLRVRVAAAGGCRRLSSSAACLMLPSNKMYSLGEKKVMSIDSSKIEKEFESDRVVGSSHGWVGLLKEEEDMSCSLSLWNPRSGSRMKLPPLDTMPHCDSKRRLWLEKVMVDDAECSRAIIFGFSEGLHGNSSWLGLCCPGRCNEWTQFGRIRYCCYSDVVASSQGRVYSVNIKQELVRWNVSDPRRPRREWKKHLLELGYEDEDDEEKKKKNFPRKPIHDLLRYSYQHLVYAKQSGQLFLVTRHYVEKMNPRGAAADAYNVEDLRKSGIYPNKTVAFDVHLLVESYEKGKRKLELRYMEHSLDGLVMFVGINNSFVVAAADFPHLNPDSIYFTDHIHNISTLVDGGHDIGIYDYKNRTIFSCYYPSLHPSCKGIHPDTYPFWITPTSTLKG